MESQALLDLMTRVGGRPECVMCTENDGKEWVAIGKLPVADELILPLFPGESDVPIPLVNHGQRVYGIACGKCGFVRLLSLDAIEAAMKMGH